MNLNDYSIGQEGPLGKKIKDIVFRSDDVIVFMDAEETIQWFHINCEDFTEQAGEIQNTVSDWESKVNKLFKKEEAYDFKMLLSESYARILHDKNIEQARDNISKVTKRIEKQGRELLKQYYAISSLATALIICLGIWVSKHNKETIENFYGQDEYTIWMTMLFGGIGAFIFTIIRLKKYSADIEIPKYVHIIDGALRIFYGIIFGLVIAIAIKSNLLLGFLNQVEKSIYVSVFLGICAGASEILIPNLIKQIETKVEQE